MPKGSTTTNHHENELKQILAVVQDLFILQGASSGMSVESIRKRLKIKRKRVTDITRDLRQSNKKAR